MNQQLYNLIYGRIKIITSSFVGEINTPDSIKKMQNALCNDAILKQCIIPYTIIQHPNDPMSIIINWK